MHRKDHNWKFKNQQTPDQTDLAYSNFDLCTQLSLDCYVQPILTHSFSNRYWGTKFLEMRCIVRFSFIIHLHRGMPAAFYIAFRLSYAWNTIAFDLTPFEAFVRYAHFQRFNSVRASKCIRMHWKYARTPVSENTPVLHSHIYWLRKKSYRKMHSDVIYVTNTFCGFMRKLPLFFDARQCKFKANI